MFEVEIKHMGGQQTFFIGEGLKLHYVQTSECFGSKVEPVQLTFALLLYTKTLSYFLLFIFWMVRGL